MQKTIGELEHGDIFYAHNDWYTFDSNADPARVIAKEYNSGKTVNLFIGQHIVVDVMEYCNATHLEYRCDQIVHKGRKHHDPVIGDWIRL